MMPIKLLLLSRSFMLFIYSVLILIRAPQLIWPGRFWAEEGLIYFYEAYTSTPWEVITTVNLGYYSLLNKIAAIAAAHTVPLQCAPMITMLFAFAVQILPGWLVLFSRLRALNSQLHHISALLFLLLVQPNQEVWLNTINSQFFLCISTAIILISEPTTYIQQILRLGVLIVAGLTGVVSCLILPLFWIEYHWTRNTNKRSEALALTAACIIQGMIIIGHPERHTLWNFKLLPFVLIAKQWILPLLGSDAVTTFSAYIQHYQLFQNTLVSCVAFLPYIVLGWGLIRWGDRHARILLIASFCIASVSFLKSLEAQSTDWMFGHLLPFGAGRYYYAPNVLLALALLIPLRPSCSRQTLYSHCFRIGCITLMGLMLTIGVYNFIPSKEDTLIRWFFDGPSWSVEVKNWRENGAEVLHIWPRPYSIELPKEKK